MSQHLCQDDSELEILPSAIPVYDPRTRISSRGPTSRIDKNQWLVKGKALSRGKCVQLYIQRFP
jgi:hypothetical protein